MSISSVDYGKEIPNDLNVIIEIPALSSPVKYEVDKDTGLLEVDRFIATAMHYPANYGYIPKTLSEDGDPLDVLVVTPIPLVHGALIRVRVLGMLNMTDDAGKDSKLIAVPINKLTTAYQHIKSVTDLPKQITAQIEHFFKHYKNLEEGKWVKIEGWSELPDTIKEITSSVARYKG